MVEFQQRGNTSGRNVITSNNALRFQGMRLLVRGIRRHTARRPVCEIYTSSYDYVLIPITSKFAPLRVYPNASLANVVSVNCSGIFLNFIVSSRLLCPKG